MNSNYDYKDHLTNEDGQAAVEYILLLGVVMVIMVSLTTIMKDRLMPANGECTGGSTNFFCQIKDIVSPQSIRYYRIKR